MFHRHESDPNQIDPAEYFAQELTVYLDAEFRDESGAESTGARRLYLSGVRGVNETHAYDPLEETRPSVVAKIEESLASKIRPSLEIVVVDSAGLEKHTRFTDKRSHYERTDLVASNQRVHSIHHSEAQLKELKAAVQQLGYLEPSNLIADELKDYFNPALYLRQTVAAKIARLLARQN